jgi:hypothetical protein
MHVSQLKYIENIFVTGIAWVEILPRQEVWKVHPPTTNEIKVFWLLVLFLN